MGSLYPPDTAGGDVISYIPLTTIFTPSQDCSRKFRLNGPSLVAFDPGYGLDIDKNVICQPPAVTSWWEQARLGVVDTDHTAVSLGPMTCPDGWETVASSVKDQSTTLHMCCPQDYYLAHGTAGMAVGDCLSDVVSGMSLTYASTPFGDSTAWEIATTTLDSDSSVGAIAVLGWNIKLAETTTDSKDTTGSETSAGLITSPPGGSPEASPSGSPGLSTGASVGIGVGVALGVIGIAALVVALWLIRRKKNKKEEKAAAGGSSSASEPKPPTPPGPSELYPYSAPQELVGHEIRRPPAELSV